MKNKEEPTYGGLFRFIARHKLPRKFVLSSYFAFFLLPSVRCYHAPPESNSSQSVQVAIFGQAKLSNEEAS